GWNRNRTGGSPRAATLHSQPPGRPVSRCWQAPQYRPYAPVEERAALCAVVEAKTFSQKVIVKRDARNLVSIVKLNSRSHQPVNLQKTLRDTPGALFREEISNSPLCARSAFRRERARALEIPLYPQSSPPPRPRKNPSPTTASLPLRARRSALSSHVSHRSRSSQRSHRA